MADELNIPTHRYYQPRYNVALAVEDISKQYIYDSGIRKIDARIGEVEIREPLFSLAEPGVWYDPSDLTTLFQDTAGTQPVTAAGQTVALVLDKSGRGNHATQSILASRPSYQVDANGRGYLSFDGVDDFLVTPTITPGTDKVQVFVGLRKLSDAARGMVVELGVGGTSGSFNVEAPNASLNNFIASSRGSALSSTGYAQAAPSTQVFAMQGEISTDNLIVRGNGVQRATSATDQGTGNFANAPVYIGRRAGTSLPFNGRLYGLVVRFGPNLDAATIAATEAWMNTKTGAY